MTVIDTIAKHLPRPPCHILEIGCGKGELAAEIACDGVRLTLMDGDGTGTERNKYRPSMEPWNDVMEAVATVKRAQPTADVRGIYADTSLTIPCDLIISILSWGFHYPVETYLPLANRSLLPGGKIILDLRIQGVARGAGEKALSDAGFSQIDMVDDHSTKFRRTVWTR